MPQGQREEASDTDQLMLLGVFVGLVILITTFFPVWIGPPLLKANLFLDNYLPLSTVDYKVFLPFVNGERDFNFAAVEYLNNRIAMPTLGYLSIALFLYYGYRLIGIIRMKNNMSKTLNLESLIRLQAKYFKFMTPVAITDNPSKSSLFKGRWAKGLKPYEFIEQKFGFKEKGAWNLSIVEKELKSHLGVKINNINDIKKLDLHLKVMVLIFALRILIRRDDSNKLIDVSAVEWKVNNTFGLKTNRLVSKFLADERVLKEIKILIKEHAFINTLLIGAMNKARQNAGKISTPEFIWLKPTDRILFYCLNQLGRKESWVEAIGATCHYSLEIKSKKALAEPHIVAAIAKIKSLSDELNDDLRLESTLFNEVYEAVNK